MARNEAKIKFTAETKDFTAGIKDANSTLTALRAGLKLNEAEFRNTGDSASFLEQKQKLLEAQLEANKQKQEALTGKLETAKKIYGENSAEVQSWTTKLTNAKTEGEKLTTALNDCEKELADVKTAEQELQTPLEKLSNEISSQENKLEDLKKEYKNVALEQGKDSDAAKELKEKIDNLNDELGDNKKKLDDVTDAVEDSGRKADEAANGGWTTAKAIFADLASNAIQECINKLKDFAKSMVDTGIEFSSSMSNVQALSGATVDELDELEARARELGGATIFSASQVADAFSYMALAGWNTEDMLSGVDGVLNLAAAADMDLAEASDIVTDYLTAFGLSAQDSAAFVDQMAYAMANSNTNVTQLGEAYKNSAATAASMGFSVEETTSALMTMANAGVKGGEAGTGLSSIMTRLATNTKDCCEILSNYGVEVYDEQGNMNSLSSILNGCAGIWGNLTDQQQANLAKTIAGTSQFSKFQTVMSGLSESAAESGLSFNDYTEALHQVEEASKNGDSAAQEMSDTMQNNLKGDIAELNSAWDEYKLKIYDDVEGPLRTVTQTITNRVIPGLTQMNTWIKTHKTLLAVIGTVIGIIAVAYGAYSVAQGIKIAMDKAEVTSVRALIAAQMAQATAQLAVLAPYLLVTAAIAAVIAIIVLCIKHWDQIKAKAIQVGGIIKNVFQSIYDKMVSFGSGVNRVISNIRNAFARGFEAIKNAIMRPIETAINFVKNGIARIKDIINGAKLQLPHFKLPHFNISGGKIPWGIGGVGVKPTIDIDWYAEGAVFKSATILNTARGFKGVGEAGPEAVAPISILKRYVTDAVQAVVPSFDYDLLADRVAKACAKMNLKVMIGEREFARLIREVMA